MMKETLLRVETTVFFRRQLKRLKEPEIEEKALQAILANPEAGDVVPGSGGFRKIRIAMRGRGKRGGARVLYLLVMVHKSAYLVGILSKNEAADFSHEFITEMKKLAPDMGKYVIS